MSIDRQRLDRITRDIARVYDVSHKTAKEWVEARDPSLPRVFLEEIDKAMQENKKVTGEADEYLRKQREKYGR